MSGWDKIISSFVIVVFYLEPLLYIVASWGEYIFFYVIIKLKVGVISNFFS